MKQMLDAFWRAVAYCVHPKVIGLSVLPLVIGMGLALGLGWLFWEPAVAGVRATLESWQLIDAGLRWIESLAGASFRSVLAPLLVVVLAAPLIVVLAMLLVAVLMAPAIVNLVAARRFPHLARLQGGGWLMSLFWTLGCTVLTILVLALSVPLWFIPPLVLVLPPLIWGWLTCQVMSFDTLAVHASAAERRTLMQTHRWPLLGIGVVSGYLGAAPSLLWATGALALVFAPLVIAVSMWLYTLVFAFSALWFAHYLLAALAALRRDAESAATQAAEAAARPPAGGEVIDLPASAVTTLPNPTPP